MKSYINHSNIFISRGRDMKKSTMGMISTPILIVLIVGVAVVAFVSAWYLKPAPPPPAPERPKEIVLTYLCEAGPEPEVMLKAFDKYSDLHPDVRFDPDVTPRDIARMKVMSEITEKRGTYDIYFTWLQDTLWMADAGAIDPLDKYIQNISSYLEKYPDFLLTSIQKDGHTYSLPVYWNSLCMFYRTDLFEDSAEKAAFKAKYGYDLRPPETWQEWIDTAEFFTRPPDLYGYCINGKAWAFYWDEYGVSGLQSAGLSPFADFENNRVNINGTAGVELLETLAELTKYSPPGWEAGDWFTFGDQLFAEGKLAMWHNWYYPWPTFQNPEKSNVVGKVGVSVTPSVSEEGPHMGQLSGGGITISAISSEWDRQAAAEFIIWLLKPENQKELALTGELFIPANLDILEDPDVNAFLKPQPFIELVQTRGQTFFRPSVELNEVQNLWVSESAEALMKIVRGEMTAKEAADWLATHMEKVLRERA